MFLHRKQESNINSFRYQHKLYEMKYHRKIKVNDEKIQKNTMYNMTLGN